jgi:hypothetical protein
MLLCFCGKIGDDIQPGSGPVLRRTQPAARNDTIRLAMNDVTWGSEKPFAYTFPHSSSFAREFQRF